MTSGALPASMPAVTSCLMKCPTIILFAVVLAFLSSCASSTTLRERRITQNAEIYNRLSEQDRALVAEGKIREGMHKEGVFLSWGRPNDIREGSRSGVPYETWLYTGQRASTQTYLSLGYGYGYDPYYYGYGGRYYRRSHLGFSPGVSTTYWQVKVGSVELLNDKVVSWEASAR